MNLTTSKTQKKSARRPQFLNLTTSKAKQVCETLNFRSCQRQKQTILQDFLQKWKVECRADGLVPMGFALFPFHLSKVLRLPRKSDAKLYEVLHLSRKIILANLKIRSKMQLFSGNQRPDLLTYLTHVSLVLRLPRDMHLSRSSSNVPRVPTFLELFHVWLTFGKVQNPLCLPLNVQKWSERGVFVHFDFRHVLRAKTACTFSTAQLPKVLQRWCVLCVFTSNVLRAITACTFSTS